MRAFDVVVIGAGPAGEVVAGCVRDHGLTVALVESGLVGGECAYYACMPSKALLRPSEALAEVRRVPGAAEATRGEIDVAATLARRDEVVHDLSDDSQLPWLAQRGIVLVRGRARLDGERRVRVGGELLEARRAVVVAVGSTASMPPVPGLEAVRPWTSRQATTVRAMPASLIVLGGGAVGVELAFAYRQLGATVTLIEARQRLLEDEEEFVGEELRAAAAARGVDVRLGREVRAVRRERAGVTVTLDDDTRAVGQELLVAVGRRPLSDDLGLETVGLEPGAFIDVGDDLRVPGAPWLYAVGDVNGRALLTHAGKYQARVAASVIAGGRARATRDRDGVPRVLFTDPQFAAVGVTLRAARERGVDARAYDVPSAATAGASFHGREVPGTARIVVDEQREVLVGATFTGFEVAEWLHAASVCVVAEVPLARLWEAIPAFPTRSEVWLRLLERRDAALRE